MSNLVSHSLKFKGISFLIKIKMWFDSTQGLTFQVRKLSEKLSEKGRPIVGEIRRKVRMNRLALPSDISYKYL